MKTLNDIHRVKAAPPARIVIYGPPGVGKTSLAAEFPAPVFIQTEDGESVDNELSSFGLLTSWDEVYSALGSLASPQHDFRTIVLDSVDALEPLIWADVCKINHWDTIGDSPHGKAYNVIDDYWRKLFRGLNYLRDGFGMNVVLIGHSCVVTWPNPAGAEFPRWDIRLHKRAHAIVEDSVSDILMIDYDMTTKEDKGKGGAKVTKSTGSTLRYIHCQGSPARNAKNRHRMPPKILYVQGEGFSSLAPYLFQTHQEQETING